MSLIDNPISDWDYHWQHSPSHQYGFVWKGGDTKLITMTQNSCMTWFWYWLNNNKPVLSFSDVLWKQAYTYSYKIRRKGPSSKTSLTRRKRSAHLNSTQRSVPAWKRTTQPWLHCTDPCTGNALDWQVFCCNHFQKKAMQPSWATDEEEEWKKNLPKRLHSFKSCSEDEEWFRTGIWLCGVQVHRPDRHLHAFLHWRAPCPAVLAWPLLLGPCPVHSSWLVAPEKSTILWVKQHLYNKNWS